MNYLLSIEPNFNENIRFFDLYDILEGIQYNGSCKIKDRYFRIKKEQFIKNQKEFNHIIIPIDKKRFNHFLDLYYDDICDFSIKKFLIKHELEEYMI
jgi:hypothetical protein